MGTRSLTIVKDPDGHHLVTVYRQYDGYPEGHGADLLEFLSSKNMVNGIPVSESKLFANGYEELAAQLVWHLKKDNQVGNIYIYPPGTEGVGEEWVYEIGPMPEDSMTIRLVVREGAVSFFGAPGTPIEDMKVVYDGPIAGFADWLESKGE